MDEHLETSRWANMNVGSLATDSPKRSPPNPTWNHSWPFDETRNALSDSPFRRIPSEVMLHIFKLLPVRDLNTAALVCRTFKMVADNDEIWKRKCATSTKLHSKSFKQIYMDWVYEKYLRNMELYAVEALFRERSSQYACGMSALPPVYPVRPLGRHHFTPVGGFKQHPNDSETIAIELSVDIDKTARELVSLLEKASRFQSDWRQPIIVKHMITRYSRFLQLKATLPENVLLIPTLDIETVWQTHLLRPEMYKADCLRLFRRVINHSLILGDVEQFLKEQAFRDTCKLYEERFGEEYCPLPNEADNSKVEPKYVHPVFCKLKCVVPVYSYWDKTHFDFSSKPLAEPSENPFSFAEADVILDGNWLNLCETFMRDMMAKVPPDKYYRKLHNIDLRTAAVRRLKKSYERFLYMASKYSPTHGYTFMHPTYAIDIVWHSHMQEPLNYASDCVRLVSYVIDHVPWPSVDEHKMHQSCNDTTGAWKQEFETDMCTDHLYNTRYNGSDNWSD